MGEFGEHSGFDGSGRSFHSSADMSDRIRVVLVDDDQDFVSLASTLLESESESLEITTYTDPLAALDRIDLGETDCIVSDYRMPGMDGIELLETVREARPELPFILFTGKGDEGTAEQAISAGASDYITKDGSSEQYAISANRIENLARQYRTQQRWVRERMFDAFGRSVFEAILDGRTQETIEQAVCDQLAASEFYSFVWIGQRSPQTGEVRPRAHAGTDDFFDSVAFSTDRNPPRSVEERALASGEREIATDLSGSGAWASETNRHGFEAAIGCPLAYEGVSYGVLGVYTERKDAFVPAELNTLDLIATLTAFSVGASKRRSGGVGRQIVEVEFDVEDTDLPFVRIASTLESNIRLTQTAYRSDGTGLALYTVEDAPEGQPCELESMLDFDVARVSDRTGSETELAVASSDPWWKDLTERYGANIGSAAVEDEGATLLIELPTGSDVRAVVDLIEARYPNAEPVARRERTRPGRSIDEVQSLLEERLTDRQREVVRTAYRTGYYEWPHEVSSEEVAELLGITQPTFAEHFWAGQKRIVELLFETETTDDE